MFAAVALESDSPTAASGRATNISQPDTSAHPHRSIGLVISLALLPVLTYVATPRFWEPGAESWKYWASASLLRHTGGFPILSHGPVFLAYLQAFLFLPYPLSIQAEYFTTHLLCYAAIFLMLRSRMVSWPFRSAFALLFTTAWIPAIGITEGDSVVAGMALLALYLIREKRPLLNQGPLPPALVMAALCHTAYIPFVVGHFLGTLPGARKAIRLAGLRVYAARIGAAALALDAALLALVLVTQLWQSPSPKNNHMNMDPTYLPVSIKEPFTLAFFQIGNFHYVRRSMPPDTWINDDWYFTNQQAFGGATTVAQAMIRRPDTVIRNVLGNIRDGVKLIHFFFVGDLYVRPLPVSLLASLLAAALLAVAAASYWLDSRDFPAACGLVVGVFAITGTLLLTWFNQRYSIALLPVALMLVAYVPRGITWAGRKLPRQLPASAAPAAYAGLGICAVITFFSSPFPQGLKSQFLAVKNHGALLTGVSPVDMDRAYPALLSMVGRDTKIMSLEDTWFDSFSNDRLEDVHQIWELAPFPDTSGRTEQLLSSMDVIAVSGALTAPDDAVATQIYLRYQLHIAPFLEKAVSQGWTKQHIDGYGDVYRKGEGVLSK